MQMLVYMFDNGEKTDIQNVFCVSLQEVSSRPLKFVSDIVFDDPWSHLFMSALAPRKYVKVKHLKTPTCVYVSPQIQLRLFLLSFRIFPSIFLNNMFALL